jgi:hypothetical protein
MYFCKRKVIGLRSIKTNLCIDRFKLTLLHGMLINDYLLVGSGIDGGSKNLRVKFLKVGILRGCLQFLPLSHLIYVKLLKLVSLENGLI